MSDIKSSLDKIKNIPKDPMIYHTKGTFFEKIGKIDNAIKEYKTAAEYDYAKSQYALANIYYDKKKYSEAEEWALGYFFNKLAVNSGFCLFYSVVKSTGIRTAVSLDTNTINS